MHIDRIYNMFYPNNLKTAKMNGIKFFMAKIKINQSSVLALKIKFISKIKLRILDDNA